MQIQIIDSSKRSDWFSMYEIMTWFWVMTVVLTAIATLVAVVFVSFQILIAFSCVFVCSEIKSMQFNIDCILKECGNCSNLGAKSAIPVTRDERNREGMHCPSEA